MLADGTEARARSHSPRTDEEIMAVVEDAINTTKDSGQLDDTDLTLKDLQIIKNSFFNTLKQSYHPRIKYPKLKPAVEASSSEEVDEEEQTS
jgi:membrane-associated HD superfamily phosphohydrolase